MAWGMMGIGSLPFSILHTFYKQRVSVVLQHAHVTFILKCVTTINEGSSRLGILSKGLTLFLFAMFPMAGRGSKF